MHSSPYLKGLHTIEDMTCTTVVSYGQEFKPHMSTNTHSLPASHRGVAYPQFHQCDLGKLVQKSGEDAFIAV